MVESEITALESELAAPQHPTPAQPQARSSGMPTYASAIGNHAMARVASSLTGAAAPRPQSPTGQALSRALAVARREAPSAAPLLSRAVRLSREDPGFERSLGSAPTAVHRTCACGGTVLPGGECSKCMANRLQRQGMPRREAQRVVLSRMKLARQQTGATRSFGGCLNANLASMGIAWALITVVGLACSLVGAIGGIIAAAPTGEVAAPATVPMGMMIGAALCIAGLTGLSTGLVLGIIKGCAGDGNFQSPAASTASADPAPGGDGGGAPAMAVA